MEDTRDDRAEGRIRTTGRGPLTWVVAVLAVVVIAVVSAVALLGSEDADAPLGDTVGTSAGPGDEEPTVTSLGSAEEDGRCMTPTPEALAEVPLALEATVVGVEDGLAVLEPVEFYAGRATDRVEVSTPSSSDAALVGSVVLEEGQRYLLAASEGRVVGCGFSGPSEPRLAELYADAFNR